MVVRKEAESHLKFHFTTWKAHQWITHNLKHVHVHPLCLMGIIQDKFKAGCRIYVNSVIRRARSLFELCSENFGTTFNWIRLCHPARNQMRAHQTTARVSAKEIESEREKVHILIETEWCLSHRTSNSI